MEQLFLACGLPKQTVTTIMMLFKNMKAMFHSYNDDTDFFDIVAEVLQQNTLTLYLSIICLNYIIWTSIDTMKENGLTPKKSRRRQYSIETIMDAD